MLTSAQIDEYLRAKKALGNVSLDVVVVSYLERAQKPNIGLSEAVDGFMAELEGRKLAVVSIRDYRGKLERLKMAFPGVTVEYFANPPIGADPHPLLGFILSVSENQQTRIHYRTKIGTFFRWCAQRGLLSIHPNKWVSLGKVSRESPEIYTPEQMETIMRIFEQLCPRLLPYFALQAFGALRPGEAMRQKKERISFRDRTIIASHKKRGADVYESRLVEDLPKNIWSWLKPLQNKRTPSLIDSQDFYQQMHRLLKESGIEWIHDGLRHSALTYYAKLHGHDKAAELAGHRAGSYTLSEHYKAVFTTKKAARAFFAIMPKAYSRRLRLVAARALAK
jgi:integrase